jgi:hypothetical protein
MKLIPVTTCALAITAMAMLGSAATAEAQAHRGRKDGVRVDLHLDLGWYQAFGLGFRVDIPIVKDGLIDSANDELSLSPGAELYFWDYQTTFLGIWPILALQWNFYVGREWSVFPELGLGFFLGETRHHFSDANSFLMRISFPAGLQLGITF